MSFIPKITNKSQKKSHVLGEIAISAILIGEITIAISPIAITIDASCEIGEIVIAILPILMIAIDADRCDRDRAKRRSRDRDRRDREIAIGAIAIVIDVDRRSSGDRRDRDRGASGWVVLAQ